MFRSIKIVLIFKHNSNYSTGMVMKYLKFPDEYINRDVSKKVIYVFGDLSYTPFYIHVPVNVSLSVYIYTQCLFITCTLKAITWAPQLQLLGQFASCINTQQ